MWGSPMRPDAMRVAPITKLRREASDMVSLYFRDEPSSKAVPGQYLMMWGLEGEQWDMVDGKHTPRPGTPFGWGEGWGEYQNATGVRRWTWCIRNGYGSDGTPIDLIRQYRRDEVTEHAVVSMAGSTWDTAPFDNLGPAAGTEEALIEALHSVNPRTTFAGSICDLYLFSGNPKLEKGAREWMHESLCPNDRRWNVLYHPRWGADSEN